MPSPRRLYLLAPAFFAAALFFPIIWGQFVYDDLVLLERNSFLQSWSALWQSFDMPFWRMVSEDRIFAGFYRPLVTVCFSIFWHLAEGAPWAFHLLSLLLHAAVSAAVTAVGLRLFKTPAPALLAGMLFAAHGAHVEPVAWASGVPDLLSTLLAMLGVLALLKEQVRRAVLFLSLALLAKEAALGVFLLAGFAWFRKSCRRELLWLLLGAIAVWALRAHAFESWAAGFDIVNTRHALDGATKTGLSFSLIARYLGFMVWPWPHAPFRPLFVNMNASDYWLGLGGLGFLISMLALGAFLRKGKKDAPLFWSLGILFASLLPVLNTHALGQFPFEERFTYLPSVGFVLLVGYGLSRIPHRPKLIGALLALLLTGHTYSTVRGTAHWQDEPTFWTWARQVSPGTMTPHLQYARLKLERAQQLPISQERFQLAEEAFASFETSMEIDPDIVLVTAIDREQANIGLGNALFVLEEFKASEQVFRLCLKPYPLSYLVHQGLANSLAARGEQLGRERKHTEATALWAEALAAFEQSNLLHESTASAFGQGACLAFLGRYSEARPWLEKSFADAPDNPEYARALAEVHYAQGRHLFARRALEDHLKARPDSPLREAFLETIQGLQQEARKP
ncbi:MAG: tetratricopeptide repeat protein [Planctomycetes bacterium]|nr:tetratricopeptide repeat protein [Planctomycetota bacterium]MBT4029555.1 tetratricopeptide repeat protein [Planctomycetota bacterium]MBT4560575.1 tetratricopeptide repeat protein [Planctomycetota bacterium]MBT5100823.1 tetratricopeptide repeat protein [Planctomycetota bacterium]MBT5120759.1 tetratricopeptide repeat protein [Planctomycetota bacterium]